MKSELDKNNPDFINDIKDILSQGRQGAYRAINFAMVQAYWLVGKRIIDQEQHGKKRAEYGKQIIATLSKELTAEFGKGFSERNIRDFRQFYLTFPDIEIWHTLSAKSADTSLSDIKGYGPSDFLPPQKGSTPWCLLSWSHFKIIMRVSDPKITSGRPRRIAGRFVRLTGIYPANIISVC